MAFSHTHRCNVSGCVMYLYLLAIIFAADSASRASASDGQRGYDAECESDRNHLLQLPGSHVDPQAMILEVRSETKKGVPGWFWSDKELSKELMAKMRMHTNTKGDLGVFMYSLALNTTLTVMLVIAFVIFSQRYPQVYRDNANKGWVYSVLPDTYLGWVRASWKLSSEEIEAACGLDCAMLIEYAKLAVRILLLIGCPMILILCPMHFIFGGNPLVHDQLSKLGMANIADGPHSLWMYWVHVLFVWWVVVISVQCIFHAQEQFLARRYKWLLRMPAPRSTTVLVEGIPPDCCNDEALKAKYCELFGQEKISSVYVVRHTRKLLSLVDAFQTADHRLFDAKFEQQSLGDEISTKMAENIEFCTRQRRLAGLAMIAERRRMMDRSALDAFSNVGFVTFASERDAAVAHHVQVCADQTVFAMSTPPCPSDVIYEDLSGDHLSHRFNTFIGYLCILGLFFGFFPIIVAISTIINLKRLISVFPVVASLLHISPLIEPFLEGVIASGALNLFMSFLPTAIVLIHHTFFQLKAGQWAQHRLMIWYFWFLMVFVLLVTAVGSSLWDTIMTLINHPTIIFELLATRLPGTTHFYLNFMTLQWVTHGMNLSRYLNLMRFKAWSLIFDESRAKELAEPEDQAYFGIGARSARFTLNLVIALVYCSLCPLIAVVAGINFVLCRTIYSYLIYFAETRKPDLGGHFWVNCLKHTQVGLVIYVIAMLGILSARAPAFAPTVATAPALFYLWRSYFRFQSQFEWEYIPYEEAVKDQSYLREVVTPREMEQSRQSYVQLELLEPAFEETPDTGGC